MGDKDIYSQKKLPSYHNQKDGKITEKGKGIHFSLYETMVLNVMSTNYIKLFNIHIVVNKHPTVKKT